jgi:hypothetical protein
MKPIVLLALESIITDHVSEQDGRQDLLIAVRKAAALEAQNAKLLEALRSVEYVTFPYNNAIGMSRCPRCGNGNMIKHDSDCLIGNALLTEAK